MLWELFAGILLRVGSVARFGGFTISSRFRFRATVVDVLAIEQRIQLAPQLIAQRRAEADVDRLDNAVRSNNDRVGNAAHAEFIRNGTVRVLGDRERQTLGFQELLDFVVGLTQVAGLYYLVSNLAGILAGFLWNYTLNVKWTWRE